MFAYKNTFYHIINWNYVTIKNIFFGFFFFLLPNGNANTRKIIHTKNTTWCALSHLVFFYSFLFYVDLLAQFTFVHIRKNIYGKQLIISRSQCFSLCMYIFIWHMIKINEKGKRIIYGESFKFLLIRNGMRENFFLKSFVMRR